MLAALLLALPSVAVADPLFVDDFEAGLDAWEDAGSSVIADGVAYRGTGSQTFTALGSGGDAWTPPISVEPGERYMLHVAYMSLGGGGYVGLDEFRADGSYIRQVWLLGDGACCGGAPWDYEIDGRDPDHLGQWNVYGARYVPEEGVDTIQITTEHFLGGIPSDPLVESVFFDDLEFGTAATPRTAPGLTTAGDCPGVLTIGGGGYAPNGRVGIASAAGPGDAEVAAGPCAGTASGLDAETMTFHGLFRADELGRITLTPELGPEACGKWIQAFDADTCRASVTAQL